MKKNIFALILSVVMIFSLTACGGSGESSESGSGSESGSNGELTDITIVLDYTPNTNHTGIYVAQNMGYFEEEGLNVSIIQPPEDGAEALVGSGNAQFGISFQENLGLALAADNPIPITAVATIINHNTSGIISLKEKGIESFADLEGVDYSTWDIPIEQAMIRECMEAEGADYELLNKVPAGSVDAISAITNTVDAIWVYEAWDVVAAELAGVEYNFIRFSEALPVLDFYTPIIVANNEFLENEPETAKAFMAAVAKGYDYSIENPIEAADILVKEVPELDLELVRASMEFLADEYIADGEAFGVIDDARWSNFYDWCFENELLSKELGSSGYSNDYLPE